MWYGKYDDWGDAPDPPPSREEIIREITWRVNRAVGDLQDRLETKRIESIYGENALEKAFNSWDRLKDLEESTGLKLT